MYWYLVFVALVVILSFLMHFSGVLRFDTNLHWSAWVIGGLVLLNGGWMVFDGGRALVGGDYVTPQSGEYAGQLGPWARGVSAVGIEPRSSLMKTIFVVYGLGFLVATGAFLEGISSAWWAILILAGLGLWYDPFGTLINVLVIIVLLLPPLRAEVEIT